jgi:hypothetical protein
MPLWVLSRHVISPGRKVATEYIILLLVLLVIQQVGTDVSAQRRNRR